MVNYVKGSATQAYLQDESITQQTFIKNGLHLIIKINGMAMFQMLLCPPWKPKLLLVTVKSTAAYCEYSLIMITFLETES